jgi:hypothetical protein
MDLIFTIAGLLMTWSLANYLKRESRLLERLAKKKPKQIYAFEVPFTKTQVLHELKHFVKRNHLGGAYLSKKNKPQLEAWLFQTDNTPDLRYPLYMEQVSEKSTVIELGAASLNSEPYFFYKSKHKKAAKDLGLHFENAWRRKKIAEKLAKQNIRHQ